MLVKLSVTALLLGRIEILIIETHEPPTLQRSKFTDAVTGLDTMKPVAFSRDGGAGHPTVLNTTSAGLRIGVTQICDPPPDTFDVALLGCLGDQDFYLLITTLTGMQGRGQTIGAVHSA